jgi:hypothetical protein
MANGSPAGGSYWEVQIFTGGVLALMTDGSYYITTFPIPTDGSWHHVVYTVSTDNGTKFWVNEYLDGNLVAANIENVSEDLYSETSIYMGSYFNGTKAFTGSLDGIALYRDKVLNLSEVKSLYNNGAGRFIYEEEDGLIWGSNCQEGTGTVSSDVLGGNAAVLASSNVWKVGGKPSNNYYLEFDGTETGVVNVPYDYFKLHGITQFFISFWIRTETSGSLRSILTFYQGDIEEFWFFSLLANGKIRLRIGNPGTSENIDTHISVNDGQWHHVVYRTSSSICTPYVDTVSGTGADISIELSGGSGDGDALYVAQWFNGTQKLQGDLDDIRIATNGFTVDKISEIYNNGQGSEITDGSSYLWASDFNFGTGTAFHDATGNGYSGTLTSSALWKIGGKPSSIDYCI